MKEAEINEWFSKLSITEKYKLICHHYITDEEYYNSTIEEMAFEAFGISDIQDENKFINNKWNRLSFLEKLEIFYEFANY